MDDKTPKGGGPRNEEQRREGPAKKPYRAPVVRSTDAFEKLALQSCAPEDRFAQGDCSET